MHREVNGPYSFFLLQEKLSTCQEPPSQRRNERISKSIGLDVVKFRSGLRLEHTPHLAGGSCDEHTALLGFGVPWLSWRLGSSSKKFVGKSCLLHFRNDIGGVVVWCGVVWCGVVWCGVVWCGVVWCGVVWCGVVCWCVGVLVCWCVGVVWCGVVWCGVVWCGVVCWCGVVWCGVVWCGVVWCGVVWCGVVWCGVVWCGGVWCVVVWWCGGVVVWWCGGVVVW